MSKADDNNEPTFDSLWNEGEESVKPANKGEPAAAAPDEGNTPVEGKTQEPGQQAKGETGGEDKPGGSDESGEPAAKPGESAAPDDKQDDWLAALPEDVRKRIEDERAAAAKAAKDAEDRYNALHGRLGPTQRQLSELQAQLARQEKKPPAEAPPAKAPDKSLDSYFDSEAWKSWAEDFPGDAKVMRAALEKQQEHVQGSIQQLQQQVESLVERLGKTEQVTSRTVLETEEQKLSAAHSDWTELNQSDDFWGWFMDDYRARQPKSLRPMFYDEDKLRVMWEDAEFAIAVIDAYKLEHPAETPPAETPPTPPVKTESTQAAPEKAPSNPRLNMSVAPDVKGQAQVPPAVKLESMTEQERFNYLWNHTE